MAKNTILMSLQGGEVKSKAGSATFPNKVQKHDTPFLIDLDLQGQQTWMAGKMLLLRLTKQQI